MRGGADDTDVAVGLLGAAFVPGGGVIGGVLGVGGRKEELISPIPMKKSSRTVSYPSTGPNGVGEKAYKGPL